jgi:6-phosphogluconolactonase
MNEIRTEKDVQAVAELAAAEAWRALTNAIAEYGHAVWLLAGGTAPMAAYRMLATKYANKLDWDKVVFALGDERYVPIDDPDSNWRQIAEALLDPLKIPDDHRLRPPVEKTTPEAAAAVYEQMLMSLPRTPQAAIRFDLVWLGVGEDGHTLSLFPGRNDAFADAYTVAVHESPKPPADRLSLTFMALTGVQQCVIIATGAGKAQIMARALQHDSRLPIVQAAKVVEDTGGKVSWLLDEQAARSTAPATSQINNVLPA